MKKKPKFSGKDKTRPDNRKKPTSPWSTKLADFRRDLKRNGIDVYSHQGLIDWAQGKYLSSKMEDAMAFVEGIATLAGAVLTSTSIANVSFVMGLYAQRHYRGSVLMKATTLIKDFCLQSQGTSSEPDWLQSLRTINSDWKQTVQNPAFAKISELLGMFVAMGIMSTKSVDFEIAGVRLFSQHVHAHHLTATSLMDAILATVTFFAEGGYYAIKTGSIRPLMFGNQELLKFDEEYVQLTTLFSAAVAGNLVKMDTSSEEFEMRVTRFIDKGNQLVSIIPGGFEKKLIMDRLVNIKKDFSEFTQKRLEGGSREAPLMMSIYGRSGVGKSTFVDFLIPYILKVNGFPCTDEYITTLNPNSKHDTNWRSYMTAMKLDDWNNSKADKTDVNPAQKIIDYCNNVRCFAEMADIERKGKTVIEPKLISITTNTRDLGARDFSNEPASIVRRPKWHIELSVKPEFQKRDSHELDTAKVEAKYGKTDTVMHDIWLVTLSYVKIVPARDVQKPPPPTKKPKMRRGKGGRMFPVPVPVDDPPQPDDDNDNKFHKPDDFTWVTYEDQVGPLEDVPLPRLLPFLVEQSKKHFNGQSFVTDCTKDVGSRLQICHRCSLPDEMCSCDPEADEYSQGEVMYVDLDRKNPDYDDSELEPHGAFLTPPPSMWRRFWGRLRANVDTFFLRHSVWDLFTYKDRWLSLERSTMNFVRIWLAATFPLIAFCEEVTIDRCYSVMKNIETNPWFHWTSYVPDSLFNDERFRKHAMLSRRDAINHLWVCTYVMKFGIFLGSFGWCNFAFERYKTAAVAMPIGCWIMYRAYKWRHKFERDLFISMAKDRELMPTFIKNVREDYLKYTLNAFVIVAAIYGLYRLYKRLDTTMDYSHQAGEMLDPDENQVKESDKAGEDKHWLPKYRPSDFDDLPKSKWTNVAELTNVTKNNLLFIKFHLPGGIMKMCDGLMLKSNYLLVPNHMMVNGCKSLTCIRKPVDGICRNAEFKVVVDMSVVMRVKEHDLCVVYIPNSGDFANIIPAFPEEMFRVELPFLMNWRDPEGILREYRGLCAPRRAYIDGTTFLGCDYTLNATTFNGMCMAILVSQSKFPVILGVHLGGIAGGKSGVAGTPLRGELTDAVSSLQHAHPLNFDSVAMGEFPLQQYDRMTFQGKTLKASSPMVKIEDTNCRVYGSCPGAVHSKSRVRDMPMSPTVERIFGKPNLWGPPKLKGPDGRSSWWPWQTNLEFSLKPSIGLPPSLLKKAYDDYVTTLKELLERRPFWKAEIVPLSEIEVINGRDDCRFIDKMAADTSVGFPLSGPKANYLTEISHPDYEYACELDPMFWEAAYEMEKCYLSGERAYPIFKAALKDEATKLDKDKVRVFQAAPVALQLLIRKYFLPICRFLSNNALISECAVGINPHSPEWDRLYKHISSKGDKCIAIDYKKYDTRMPCQLMYASYSVFIDLAVYCGNYSADDIQIMKGIATDVCNCTVAYNGELVTHIGTNPSGQNLTVYSNSINNSLLHRCGFFHMYPEEEKPFNECVSISTYGDDAAGTVNSAYEKYNMITLKEFFATHDIQITMADKDAKFVEYLSIEDVDFLKRKFIYHPDLQIRMGALDKQSILKPMHSGLKSKVPDEIIMADALDNGLRESLYHGKEAYEDFREKSILVACEHKIDHIMKLKDETYEDMLYTWACKHGLEKRLGTKYAEVAAYKTKQSSIDLITDAEPFSPEEGVTLRDG